MSDEIEHALECVGSLYSQNLEQHGLGSQSVGWPDREAQVLRFDKLARLLEHEVDGGPISVNDFGCGYGAMFSFLEELRGVRLESYFGYDISLEMLDAARTHINDPRAELIRSPAPTHEADWSFASGTFNVRMNASDDAWRGWIESTLRELATKSRKGLAFNLLTSHVDWRKPDLFYADPGHFVNFCKRELARYVTLLHDYRLYEWTLLVWHEPPTGTRAR